MKILAGITLFNPDLVRLKDNLRAIAPQVDAVVCFDNGSRNSAEVREMIRSEEKAVLIEGSQNFGVAYALNRIFEYAESHQAEWIITLDQDSVCPSDLVPRYLKALEDLNDNRIAVLCPVTRDRNFEREQEIHGEYEQVKDCITSASFNRVSAWKAVGGFYEPLFIDFVDYDFCAKLVEHGFTLYRVNRAFILHEIGHGENHRLFGREVTALNHSAERKYYMVRNHIYYMNLHRDVVNYAYERNKCIFLFIKTILFEQDRRIKLSAMFRGLHDGKEMVRQRKRNLKDHYGN